MIQEDRNKLLSFIGYGTLKSPIWFLGMEEGFDKTISYGSNLQKRLAFSEPVMDMQVAHNLMGKLYWKPRSKISQVWQWCAKFTRALVYNDDQWCDLGKANDYARDSLGRHNGETLLVELLPLPRHGHSDWPEDYKALYPNFGSYKNDVLPKRKQWFGDHLTDCRPQYLLCYGETNYPEYQSIVGDRGWDRISEKVFAKNLGHTQVVLAPFFGMGRLTKEDACQIVKHLKQV